jgi:hypothetical protein
LKKDENILSSKHTADHFADSFVEDSNFQISKRKKIMKKDIHNSKRTCLKSQRHHHRTRACNLTMKNVLVKKILWNVQ